MQASDLALTYHWVNQPYALRFWQMQGSFENYKEYYSRKNKDRRAATFMLCYMQMPIALFEVYQVPGTAFASQVQATEADYGIHLLMAPHAKLLPLKRKLKKVSRESLKAILEMLFSFSAVNRVFAEPDALNLNAHKLAEAVGFSFIQEIQLDDKIARLYVLSKEHFMKSRDLL